MEKTSDKEIKTFFDLKAGKKWELVYFLSPYCDGTCAHCWSSDVLLGRYVSLDWHEGFWYKIAPEKLSEIRLTGGEPFLHKKLGSIVKIVAKHTKNEVPIKVFTSGRHFISLEKGEKGVKKTKSNLLALGVVERNIEIHLSADEYHAGALYRYLAGKNQTVLSVREQEEVNKLGEPFLRVMVDNFLEACRQLKEDSGDIFGGAMLKIHTDIGRLDYHRNIIFGHLSHNVWDKQVVSSEGLIKSGRAIENISGSKIISGGMESIFILPGAEFFLTPQSQRSQKYLDETNQRFYFLDYAKKESKGAFLLGWWNIINRQFHGGSAYDSLFFIGK